MCDSVYVLVTNFPVIIRNGFRLLHTLRFHSRHPIYYLHNRSVIILLTPREGSNPRNKEYVASPFVRIAVTSHPVLSKLSKAITTFSREANQYIMKKTATKGPTVTARVLHTISGQSITSSHNMQR